MRRPLSHPHPLWAVGATAALFVLFFRQEQLQVGAAVLFSKKVSPVEELFTTETTAVLDIPQLKVEAVGGSIEMVHQCLPVLEICKIFICIELFHISFLRGWYLEFLSCKFILNSSK